MFATLGQYIEKQVSWKQPEKAHINDIKGGQSEDRRFASSS